MTDEILNLMDEMRAVKNREEEEKYKILNRRIHRECIAAKEKWMNDQCVEIGDLKKRDQRKMYERVKEVTRSYNSRNNIAIKKQNGAVVMEEKEIQARWRT